MSDRTTHEAVVGPVLVDGEPGLVVDATAAALRGHGVDARAARSGDDEEAGAHDAGAHDAGAHDAGASDSGDAVALVMLVPAGAEAAFRAAGTAGRSGLAWGAIVDGRQDARGAATADALVEAGASWVLGADAGLEAVVQALSTTVPAGARPAAGRDGEAPPSAAARLASLSLVERTELESMAEGRTVAQSAAVHGCTEAEVRGHRRALGAKLGVGSQLAAVALLFRQQAEDRAHSPAPGPDYAPEACRRQGGRGGAPAATHPGPRPAAPVPNLA